MARFRRVPNAAFRTADPAAVTDLGDARALPRMPATAARVLGRLLGSCVSGLRIRERSYALHWIGDPKPAEQHARYAFRLGNQAGLLQLDTPAEAVLLGDRLARTLPHELRQLLVAESLQAVADRLEAGLGQHFEWTLDGDPAAPALRPQIGLAFVLAPEQPSTPSLHGALLLADAAALERLLPARIERAAAPLSPHFEALRQPLRWRVGSTTLSLAELRGIRRGDIVSVERWTPEGPGLRVSARWGGEHGIELQARAEGARLTIHELKDPTMNRDPHALAAADGGDAAASSLPLDRLDALEVALRFEIGELSLSLGELRSLRPGQVLELGAPLNRCPVRLVAHGNLLGHGHLVAVGERLGVRVAEFAPDARVTGFAPSPRGAESGPSAA